MEIRDRVEEILRSWDRYEVNRGTSPIIDFDFCPPEHEVEPATSRLEVYRHLQQCHVQLNDDDRLAERIESHLAFLRALMGARPPLADYVRATQGCSAEGWPSSYVESVHAKAIAHLADIGIPWGPATKEELEQLEGPVDSTDAPDIIRAAAEKLEPAVRNVTGAAGDFNLTVETVDIDDYWSYWLDGSGSNARLRLNLRKAEFTEVRARQFGLHEVLGHALQSASIAKRCTQEDVPWVRILCVHSNQQVLFEGLAQAMPLFATPDDKLLIARTRLDHYHHLVRAELHLAINAGTSIEDCARHASERVPYWTDEDIADYLADRGANPLLRSYLWAYPAGYDWFVALADHADQHVVSNVLHEAYRAPLTPGELEALWPDGPTIGGSASSSSYLADEE